MFIIFYDDLPLLYIINQSSTYHTTFYLLNSYIYRSAIHNRKHFVHRYELIFLTEVCMKQSINHIYRGGLQCLCFRSWDFMLYPKTGLRLHEFWNIDFECTWILEIWQACRVRVGQPEYRKKRGYPFSFLSYEGSKF